MTSTAPAREQDGTADPGDRSASTGERRPEPAGPATSPRREWVRDVAVCLAYGLAAVWVFQGLWADPNVHGLAHNLEDQTLIEWFLAVDTRLLFGDLSLVADQLNAPNGINMLTNATSIALGVLMAPVTLTAGAGTSFAVLMAGNLAATATAWYLLFTRTLRVGRPAAAIGAAFCGFAPGMVSQSNSHWHMTAQWLVPAMVWCVVRLVRAADPDDPEHQGWRRLTGLALLLATLVVLHVFIGEEVLFLTAVTLALMTIGYAAAAPALARRVLPRLAGALAITCAVAGALLAYPLWVQFAGPQSVPNGVFSAAYFSADLASFVAFSPLSVAGSAEAARLSTGSAEYNTFLGLPLILVTIACALWLRRRPLVIACLGAAVVMTVLSLGPRLVVGAVRTSQWLPYALLDGTAVIDGALPMRFALALVPLIATVLALAVDRALAAPRGLVRFGVPIAAIAALLPLAPMPLPTAARPPIPEFFAGGHWRECVEPGGVLVTVPLPTPVEPEPMRWAAAANAQFGLPEGFFIGPYGAGGSASMGTYQRPTSALLSQVARDGQPPVMNPDHREQAARDIAFWGASCVVLPDTTPHQQPLRATLDGLFGPGTPVADAWVWRV